ncbi:MAG: cephalosporin hydroxylase family protein [Bacteroidota bacterium]
MNSFEERNKEIIKIMGEDDNLRQKTRDWFLEASKHEYSYHFNWMGRPIIQFPQDIVAMQEIIWKIKPDLIFETGIAHGGSLIFSASMLELIGGDGQVLGVDIDIRDHNRMEIEKHSMMKRITMIQGSSIDKEVANQVYDFARNKKNILVILDSNHTGDHVEKELELYAELVSLNSYLLVYDTIVEDMPPDFVVDRPWGVGNNPKTAVHKFLQQNKNFIIDREIQDKLQITVAPDGYLKRIK